MECWETINEYEGLYEISNLGRIRNIRYKNILKPGNHRDGYLKICLSKNNSKRTFQVHRLVALAFLPKVNGKKYVNHKDGNKKNNNVNNLEWCTRSENQKHAYKLGLQVPLKGECLKHSKLTEVDIYKIFELSKRGVEQYNLAEMFNVNQSTISRVLNGRRWSHLKVGEKRSV